MTRKVTPVVLRLLARSIVTEDGCWEWQGARHPVGGYGQVGVKEDGKWRMRQAHRVAYKEFNGVDPGNLFVCHKCDNPSCFNPLHLFLGTYADNIEDCIAKGRGRGTIANFLGRHVLMSDE